MLLLTLPIAFALDWLFGDPPGLYHPVRLIGACISAFERILRRLLPAGKNGELVAGIVLALLIPVLFGGAALALTGFLYRRSPLIWLIVDSWFCFRLLAAKSLRSESMAVYDRLATGNLPAARKAVGRIVGRDTDRLDESEIARATVETVAENTSDGIVAPMLYMALGGCALGFWYKAVNTMDSMVGYKNDRYLYFGRAAAKLDDAANWLPARISAILMLLAARLCSLNSKSALAVYRRDRRNHTSPNAAHTEAVCAGALEVQLGGDSVYFGKVHHKPTIGDPIRPLESADIPRANKLTACTGFLCLLVCCLLRWLLAFAVF